MTGHPLVSNAQFDATVHIVLDDFGGRLGRAYCETGEAEADEKTIVDNIISGEYACPVRVVAFNTAEGWALDVTEDIARAVQAVRWLLGMIIIGELNTTAANNGQKVLV